MEVALQHCSQKSWIAILGVLPPTFKKTALQQIRLLLQVVKSCYREKRVGLLFQQNLYMFRIFTAPRQTCFATSDETPVYSVTPCNLSRIYPTCKTWLVGRQVWTWVVKPQNHFSTLSSCTFLLAMLRQLYYFLPLTFQAKGSIPGTLDNLRLLQDENRTCSHIKDILLFSQK